MTAPLPEDDGYVEMCECEPDWSCPLHASQAPFLDRRFQGQDNDEARAFGRFQDVV